MHYEDILDEALSELRSIIQSLLWADMAVLTSSPIQKRSAHLIISSSYVLIAAVVEKFFRQTVKKLGIDICQSTALQCDIKPSLHSIFGDQHINSLRDLRDYQKSWEKRIEIFDLQSSNLPLTQFQLDLPLDGKTIRPVHLDVIWRVFSLPNTPFPNLQCRAALVDVADSRNDVAHGHINFTTFARKKGTTDTLNKITRIEELLTHVSLQAMAYIANQGYLK